MRWTAWKEESKNVKSSLKPSVADNFAILNDEDGIFAYIKVSNTNGANLEK